jgi:hypothetical protein
LQSVRGGLAGRWGQTIASEDFLCYKSINRRTPDTPEPTCAEQAELLETRMIPHRPLVAAAIILCAGALASAAAEAASLSLVGGRFDVEASWQTADGHSGTGTPVPLTDETGYFWFFSPTNVEVVVKGLDACAGTAPRFWIFAGGLTNTAVTLTVTDQATGQQKIYRNPAGQPFQPIQDTDAFATCATKHCGHGNFAELAASPRADLEAEAMAVAMGGGLTASQPLYDRLVADLASIRRQKPELVGLGFGTAYNLSFMEVTFDFATATAITTGEYHAWDCLNSRYGVDHKEGPYSGITMALHFAKVLDIRQLVAEYRALPGVTAVTIDGGGTPVYTPPQLYSSICGKANGSRNQYFIRQPGAGVGTTFYFTSEPGAKPHYVGSTAGDASDWILAAQQCFNG